MAGKSWKDQELAFFGTSVTASPAGSASIRNKKNDGNPTELFSSGASSIRKLARDVKYGTGRVSRRITESVGEYPAQALRQISTSPHASVPAHHCPPPSRAAARRPGTTEQRTPASAGRQTFGRPESTGQSAPSSLDRLKIPRFPSLSSVRRWVADAVPSCRFCGALAPNPYSYHPFFPNEKICAHHQDVPKCSGCNRFETPRAQLLDSSKEFISLEDNGRKLCPACTR